MGRAGNLNLHFVHFRPMRPITYNKEDRVFLVDLLIGDGKKTVSLTVRTDPTIRLRRKRDSYLQGNLILGFPSTSLVIVSGRSGTLVGQGPLLSCIHARIPFHGRQLSHGWLVRVRFDISGPCQCGSGLISGPLLFLMPSLFRDCLLLRDFSLIGYPTGITSTYFKSHTLIDIVRYTSRHLAALCVYYAKEMDLFAFIRHSDPTKEHSVEMDDDVLEEIVAKGASEVVAEKTKKKRKRKVDGDASGPTFPLKKLREDYHVGASDTMGKSLDTMRELVPDGSSVPPTPDVGPTDFVSGPNLRTCPSSLRSHAKDALMTTVAVTTTVTADASIVLPPRVRVVSKNLEIVADSTFAGGVNADVADDLYVCRDLTDRLAPPALFAQQRAMDYDQLYSEFNVWAARQVCLGAEVRMRAKHTLKRKCELEDKCVEQALLLSEIDKSLLSLKEAEAAKAIRLHGQLTVVEAADATNGGELRDLKEKNFALEGERDVMSEKIATLKSVNAAKEVASLESKRDCLVTQKNSLESAFKLFRECMEALQDEQEKILGDRSSEYLQALGQAIGCAVNKGIQDGLKAGIDHGQAKSKKDSCIFDLMDSLRLEGTLAEIPGAENLQSSSEQLMLPIHRPKDNVVIGETSFSSSLQVVHLRVQRFRGEVKEKRLLLMDVITPLVEPLSSKSLTGEASTSSAPITTLSTTFASSDIVLPTLVFNDQVLDVEPHNEDPSAMTFEKEELGTSPE
nr:hypothetical protein [Tanacetum cinerariifolium]